MDTSTLVKLVLDSKRLAGLQPYCSVAELNSYQEFSSASLSTASLNSIAQIIGHPAIPDGFPIQIMSAVLGREQTTIEQISDLLHRYGLDTNGMLSRALWIWRKARTDDELPLAS